MLLKRYLLLLICIGAGFVPVIAFAQGCTQSSLKGAYGFVGSMRVVPTDPQQHTARKNVIAVVLYDGGGNVRLQGSVVEANGTSFNLQLHGTYRINEECLGQLILLNSNEQKAESWRFAMVNGGLRLLTLAESTANVKPLVQERR